MSNVIQLLDTLGQQGRTGAISDAELRAAVAAANLEPAVADALLRRDAVGLNRLLKGRGNLMLLLFPAEPDTPAEAPSDGEGKDEGDGGTPEDGAAQAARHARGS
jgi:hypothetical protein